MNNHNKEVSVGVAIGREIQKAIGSRYEIVDMPIPPTRPLDISDADMAVYKEDYQRSAETVRAQRLGKQASEAVKF